MSSRLAELKEQLLYYGVVYSPIWIKTLSGLAISGFNVSWRPLMIKSHFWFGIGNGLNLSSLISGCFFWYLFILNGRKSGPINIQYMVYSKLIIAAILFLGGAMYDVQLIRTYFAGLSLGTIVGTFLSETTALMLLGSELFGEPFSGKNTGNKKVDLHTEGKLD